MGIFSDGLLAARSTMAFSLGFHIIFAAIGMVMPFFMATSHFLYLRTGHKSYLSLTKMWSKGVAILFATGAVSGTVLSFELGLLWPGFMKHAGSIIGMPFSWEGTAFFLEAIAIGIFLYGWDKIPRWWHWFSGVMVGVSGLASGIFVVSANSWMNTPAGFDWVNGAAQNVDPVAAMFNKHWFQQSLHMSLASFEAVGFVVAGIHAYLLIRGGSPRLNAHALRIALTYAAVAALIQPVSGHFSAQKVAENQPAKLAAMEALFVTERGAPLLIGGIPDEDSQTVKYGIEIPGALSFLAFNDFKAEVKGLDQFPREDWPKVKWVHFAFQIMVGIGSLLAAVAALFLWKTYIRKGHWSRPLLWLFVLCAPLGFVALEAGWIVTELGRQPWIIYGIMRTSEAVSAIPGLGFHFGLFIVVYGIVGVICMLLLYRLIRSYQKPKGTAYGA